MAIGHNKTIEIYPATCGRLPRRKNHSFTAASSGIDFIYRYSFAKIVIGIIKRCGFENRAIKSNHLVGGCRQFVLDITRCQHDGSRQAVDANHFCQENLPKTPRSQPHRGRSQASLEVGLQAKTSKTAPNHAGAACHPPDKESGPGGWRQRSFI